MKDDKQFLVEMGKRIALKRKEMKLTQEQLAEQINLSLQSVSCIELGKKAIRPDNLVNICRTLNTTADYLLTGTVPPEKLHGMCKDLSILKEDDLKLIQSFIDRLKENYR